ncbi:MAG: folate-binding protein YgfZ [Alphaproteobacteria bacterium]|nr:folate-binding protein YgfZ [Alphaproteobacteria bacterium]
MYIAELPHRGVIEIEGEDKASFLQGLMTNDIHLVTPSRSIYTLLLTPQGRFLYDLFIMEKEGAYLLEGEASRLEDLLKKLTLYKLRSKVTLKLRPDLTVYALWGEGIHHLFNLKEEPGNTQHGIFVDPRLAALGARTLDLIYSPNMAFVTPEDYDTHRLELGVPEGGKDLIPEKSIPLECSLDELNAISWTKGCYMGQELTARTKHRGLVRKRLIPVKIEGNAPGTGTKILLKEEPVGEMRSHNGFSGLALLRIEALSSEGEFVWGDAHLKPHVPPWMHIEDPS